MLLKILFCIISSMTLYASGAYDGGTSAGKGKIDLALTWNPFNYFKQGQSYIVFGYGITEKLDLHGYYSSPHSGTDNYYGGIFYQFHKSKYFDLATAFGLRKYINNDQEHLFSPQFLYTIKVSDRLRFGGSLVNIKSLDTYKNYGIANDLFLSLDIYENKKIKIDFTVGQFNPVLWEPANGDWHGTYSIDIKIK